VTWTLEELGFDKAIEALPIPALKLAPHFCAINSLGSGRGLVYKEMTMNEPVAIAHCRAARYHESGLMVSVD
jgi:hypothetical protein